MGSDLADGCGSAHPATARRRRHTNTSSAPALRPPWATPGQTKAPSRRGRFCFPAARPVSSPSLSSWGAPRGSFFRRPAQGSPSTAPGVSTPPSLSFLGTPRWGSGPFTPHQPAACGLFCAWRDSNGPRNPPRLHSSDGLRRACARKELGAREASVSHSTQTAGQDGKATGRCLRAEADGQGIDRLVQAARGQRQGGAHGNAGARGTGPEAAHHPHAPPSTRAGGTRRRTSTQAS